MPRRQHLTLAILLVVLVFISISYLFSAPPEVLKRINDETRKNYLHKADSQVVAALKPATPQTPQSGGLSSSPPSGFKIDLDSLPSLTEGDSIAPKLENATLKAELGRATWKFLHTMVARFPENPTPEERTTLSTFIQLFSRLYPCGDCARHFRKLLSKYPPQTSSRNAAAGWMCFAHNLVNERLGKEVFDCNKIGDFYDCGCGDDKEKKDAAGNPLLELQKE